MPLIPTFDWFQISQSVASKVWQARTRLRFFSRNICGTLRIGAKKLLHIKLSKSQGGTNSFPLADLGGARPACAPPFAWHPSF